MARPWHVWTPCTPGRGWMYTIVVWGIVVICLEYVVILHRTEPQEPETWFAKCVLQDGDHHRCLREMIRHKDLVQTPRKDPVTKHRAHPRYLKALEAKYDLKSTTDDPVLEEKYYQKASKIICPYKYDVVLSPNKPCENDTYIIILVHSFHPYEDKRRAIRNTWGGVAEGHHQWPGRNISKKFKFMFVLGHHTDKLQNTQIYNESQIYDDILQGNFDDSYKNMTLKSLLGLKYVSEHCPNARYLLKTDDDMIVNLPYLVDILEDRNLNRSIMGPLNRGSKVYRYGKWNVSREVFPFIHYPPYESGAAYVITNDIVPELYDTAQYVPQFHVDDVYITGVLGKIIGVNHVKQEGFAYWTHQAPKVCDLVTNKKVTGTKMKPQKLQQFWKDLKADPIC